MVAIEDASELSGSDLRGVSALGDSAIGPKPKCFARMDFRSSIGVYIPRDFVAGCDFCGGEWLRSVLIRISGGVGLSA